MKKFWKMALGLLMMDLFVFGVTYLVRPENPPLVAIAVLLGMIYVVQLGISFLLCMVEQKGEIKS